MKTHEANAKQTEQTPSATSNAMASRSFASQQHDKDSSAPQPPLSSEDSLTDSSIDHYSLPSSQQESPSNHTGLPDNLKAGIEQLSGYSMDSVRVHYNSTKPSQLQAHAYTQGNNIHIASGQEQHLPHEAWHVVQQMQGRVKPTLQMKEKLPTNDEAGLEKEADVMGLKASQESRLHSYSQQKRSTKLHIKTPNFQVIQRLKYRQLTKSQKAQVDAKAETEYYRQASLFEEKLGRQIAATSEANSAVAEMTKRIKKLVDAWAKQVNWNLDNTYKTVFGQMGAQDTGSISPFVDDIKAVLKGGTLRERLTLIYSAIRSDMLQTLLQVAFQDATQVGPNTNFKWKANDGSTQTINQPKGFAKKAGLKKHLSKNVAVQTEIRNRTNTAAPVNQRSDLFGRKQLVTDIERSGEKQFVQEDKGNLSNPQNRQTIETSELTERELRNQLNRLRQADTPPAAPLTKANAKQAAQLANQKPVAWLTAEYQRLQNKLQPGVAKNGATPTQWVSGENWYRAQVDSKLSIHASKIKARLRAATSGTTDMFLHAAQYLGMDSAQEMKKVRLAMLAWMLPAKDHSFYEIMTSATQYGLNDFNPDQQLWKAYEKPIEPLKLSINQKSIPERHPIPNIPQGKYPGWYLSPASYSNASNQIHFKDLLAEQWLSSSSLKVRSEAEIGPFLAAGVPQGMIEQVDDPTLQTLKQLLALVSTIKLNDANQKNNDVEFQKLIQSQTVTNLKSALGNNALIVVCTLTARLHQNYTLPDDYQPYLTTAKLLIPTASGNKRISDNSLSAVDPKTSTALINPDWGSKGSGKKGTDSAYATNKKKFIEEVLEYQPNKYRHNPEQMNAWFETYERRLSAAFPNANLDFLRTLNAARVKAKGTPQEAALEKAFDQAYQKVFGLENLSEAEKIAINLYSVSAVANSLNAATKGDAKKMAKWGNTAELLISALEKLPPFTGGPVYRGDGNRGFQVGAIITYQEFVSTAKTVKTSFINKPGMAWATYAVVIEKHHSGKDIMPLSGYSSKTLEKTEGEILFPPGTRFVVKRIEDWRNLQSPLDNNAAELQQVMTAIPQKQLAGEDVSALEARKKALQARAKQIPGRDQLVNKVWVYLDEV